MKKYRIVKHTYYRMQFMPNKGKSDLVECSCYEVQKRFLGFLWWYNFNNIDGITTGTYSQLWEAQEAIAARMDRNYKKEIVQEYD